MIRQEAIERNRNRAQELAEERILDVLVPPAKDGWGQVENNNDSTARQAFRKKLREGSLDDKEIEIEVAGVNIDRKSVV